MGRARAAIGGQTSNNWRRTAFTSDWTLLDPSGEPLARLYKVMGGPQDGQWYWSVLFMPDGSVGFAACLYREAATFWPKSYPQKVTIYVPDAPDDDISRFGIRKRVYVR